MTARVIGYSGRATRCGTMVWIAVARATLTTTGMTDAQPNQGTVLASATDEMGLVKVETRRWRSEDVEHVLALGRRADEQAARRVGRSIVASPGRPRPRPGAARPGAGGGPAAASPARRGGLVGAARSRGSLVTTRSRPPALAR